MASNSSGNKEKLSKAIINIIKTLKISTGLKKEKYMDMVRDEFNLDKNEKWVITKLRMMLVRLDSGLELLQIRKSENNKIQKRQPDAKEATCDISSLKLQQTKSVKETNLATLKTDRTKNSLMQAAQVRTFKKMKTAKKVRKSLECRQLEKLRNMKFGDHKESLHNCESKVAFLKALGLDPQVIYL